MTKMTHPIDASAASLAICPQSEEMISSDTGRLFYFVQPETRTYNVRTSVKGPFEDEADFYARGLRKEARLVRRYTIVGHPDTALFVPFEDLDRHQEVRYSRFVACSAEPKGGWHAIPEDVVAVLDDMPRSDYFSAVTLLLEDNPVDDWPRQVNNFKDSWRSQAAALADGELGFYKIAKSDIRFAGMHEWFHRLEKFHAAVRKLLEVARYLDSTYLPDGYAHVAGEHGPVFGQNLLGLDGQWVIDIAKGGPFRALVLMAAVDDVMKSVPPARRSRCHSDYERRIGFVREFTRQSVGEFILRVGALCHFLAEQGVLNQVQAKELMATAAQVMNSAMVDGSMLSNVA
jgi:hypothetical protein